MRRMRTRDNTPRRREGTTAAYGPTSEVLGLVNPGPSGAERDDAQSPVTRVSGETGTSAWESARSPSREPQASRGEHHLPGRSSSPIPASSPRARRSDASGIACTTATRPRAGRQPADAAAGGRRHPESTGLPLVGRPAPRADQLSIGRTTISGQVAYRIRAWLVEPSSRPDSGNARGRSRTPARRARPAPGRLVERGGDRRVTRRGAVDTDHDGSSAGGDASAVAPRITASGQSPCATSATAVEPTGGPEGELVVGVDQPQRMVPLGGLVGGPRARRAGRTSKPSTPTTIVARVGLFIAGLLRQPCGRPSHRGLPPRARSRRAGRRRSRARR